MMLVRDDQGEVVAKKEIEIKALLTILIANTLDFFSIGKTMGDTQMAMTIDMILEDYYMYKPDYFILCFKRAMKGNYGIAFDRVDGQIIFQWLAKFDQEYTEEIENERLNQKKRIERDTALTKEELDAIPADKKPVPMPDYVKEAYVKVVAPIMPEPKQTSKEQIFVQSIRNDFEAICELNGDKSDAFVHFYGTPGKSMNIKEYTDYRLLILEKPKYYLKRF